MIKNDLIAFSQTRWGFVYQRTQHLLSRHAKHRRVFFIEEPVLTDTHQVSYRKVFVENGVEVIKPLLSKDYTKSEMATALKRVVDDLIEDEFIINYSTWYDNPVATSYTRHLSPISMIYDCIHESSPENTAEFSIMEIELLEKADLVFTANEKLYNHRKNQHHNIYNYPNSIDLNHFRQARQVSEPLDQKKISGPKLGFYGDISEHVNFDLLTDIADYRPSWNFILLGPVKGNCMQDLPQRPNIYFFGKKDYKYLPHYFAGWDVAIAPYRQEKNQHSPSQVDEHLATGCPVVTTTHPELKLKYEPLGLVTTADTATCFVAACEELMHKKSNQMWLQKVDHYLESKSWDQTFDEMKELEIKTLMSSLPQKRNKFSTDMMQI